jgi:phenylalanyl-tRNA synthetase beta chain
MRVPLEWLEVYCDPMLPVEAIEERLTMTGTKVESIHHHGVGALDRFVIGRVLEVAKHPDADRLSVCRVDVGNGAVAQIVCGAPNVAAGQTVAVARPGAVMPDGTELGAAQLRGVESQGMILAEDELGIGTDHAGIMVLDGPDAELATGAPLADVLPISTPVLELEITPNRPDCLGIYGVARELHAATGAPLAPPPWANDRGTAGELDAASVEVRCADLCPRFTARVYEDVKIGPSPPWLKARLMAAGQRPINNVVDITNYVMLETGQPLHAFDLDRVAGAKLVVRRAADGEPVETLDGQLRTLDSEMVVIEDGEGPTSIAGVMGGARSEVSEQTTRVLLEVASWDGPNIHRTSRLLGLRSEASARFEKGLAPEQAMEAQAVAGELLIELYGARLLPGTIDIAQPLPEPQTIRLREARIARILGMPVPRERAAEILASLEFGVADAPDGLDVTVPPFRRNDVYREIDLVEEVARIDGLERLPATLPAGRGGGALSREQRLRRRAADALADRGLFEIVGWSFVSPTLFDRLRLGADDARRRAVAIENPLSEDQSLLRTTLLASLLDAARHNAARGMPDLALFEIGTLYAATETADADNPHASSAAQLPREHRALAALLHGSLTPPSWGGPAPRADLFAAKALLETLAETLRVPDLAFEHAPEPFLHPGRAARVSAAGAPVGWLGELHPLVAGEWDLDGGAAFELDLDALLAAVPAQRHYVDLISYPALRLDIAVVVDEDTPATEVVRVVREAAGALLDTVRVFDVYHGEQLPPGRKSLALALSFRAPDRTLTDEDVKPVREQIVAALASQLGGELRA